MIRILKWFSFALLGLMLILSLIGFWLLNTESGLRWSVRQAPDTISFNSIQGTLNDFSFTGLQVQLDSIDITVSTGKLEWALIPLLSRNVNIEMLHADGITITNTQNESPTIITPYQPWQGVDLPFDIKLNSLQLSKLTMQSKSSKNAQAVQSLFLDRITSQLALNNNILAIQKFSINEEDNSVLLSGDIDLSAHIDATFNLNHSIKWKFSEQSIDNTGSISGTWSHLKINQLILLNASDLSPLESTLDIDLLNVLSHEISWRGTLLTSATEVKLSNNKNNQAIPQNTDGHDGLQLGSGDFSFTGAFQPAQGLPSLLSNLEAQINISHEQFSQWNLNTQLSVENDSFDIASFELNQLGNTQDHFANKKPVSKRPLKQLGKLNINGRINGLSNFISQTKNSDSNADITGQWSSLSWPLKGNVTDGYALSQSNGSLSLRGLADDFVVTAQTNGKSYSNPLTANIDVRILPNLIKLNSIKLNSGETKLDISGQLGDQLALNWLINSPDLSALMPNLSGDLKSQGQLKGTREKPKFAGNINSEQFRYNDILVTGTALTAKGALSSDIDKIIVKANIMSLVQANSKIANNVNIDLNGSGKDHTLNISSQLFGQSDFHLNARGGLTDTSWTGRLESLELNDPTYDTWRLKQSVAIKRTGPKLVTDSLCLTNFSQSVCVKLNANAVSTNASAIIKNVNLNNLNPLLSLYDATASGLLNGEFDYQKSNTMNAAKIEAKLDSSNSIISFKQVNGQTQELSFASVTANIHQQNVLKVDAKLQLDNGDHASFDLNIDSAIEHSDFLTSSLNGTIVAQLDDLTALKAATPMLSSLDGSLNSDIKLSGSLNDPKVAMQTNLRGANLSIADLGLNLQSINMMATSVDTQKIALSGSLISGKGTLNIDGSLDFSKLNDPKVRLSLKGQKLELMKTPEILIDGDVDLNIVVNNELLDLNGSVNLIQADLDFQPPENAILASEDVVLLGLEVEQQVMQTQMNLSLNLGDKTHIRAQGLDAFLVGRLQILQEAGGILKGKGQIDVKQGRYDAYNQKLKIDKGQLIFNGGSIDDPALDMRAQKTVNDITAGVSVTGRANAPILRLYSTPSMTDQDVLSVLIFDKKLGNLGSQDGFTLLKIANSLRGTGESQVGALTDRIQDSLGLSKLELQLDGDAPSVLAGKQLSSKFYIGYGYGLLDAAQSLILRYKISKAWSIQGDLGADSGADLRYQIER